MRPNLKQMKKHLRGKTHQLKQDLSENFNQEAATAEIKFVELMLLTGNAFLPSAQIMKGLKRIFRDSPTLQSIQNAEDPETYRRRIADIACYVIAPAQQERLQTILQTQEVAVCIDESTDITCKQSLSINVRFADLERKKFATPYGM